MEFMSKALGMFQMGTGIVGAGYQKDIDDDRVELEYKSNLEDIRRKKFEHQTIQGTAKAFSENSGVLHSGGSTAQGFLDTMADQFAREIDFMRNFAMESRKLGHDASGLRRNASVLGSISRGIGAMST